MWFRSARNRQWHELFASYNLLIDKRDSKLNIVDCSSEIKEQFVVVQDSYKYHEFEEWFKIWPSGLKARYLKAVVFDQPKEIGFLRGITLDAIKWTEDFPRSIQRPVEIVFTGMDTAKSDRAPAPLLRYYNHYLTHAIENQMGRVPGLPITQRDSEKRFVVLVKKRKQWRLWFMARLYNARVWDQVDYTSPAIPTFCDYFYAASSSRCNETAISETVPRHELLKARRFVEAVKPRIFRGTAHQGNEFANHMLEPRRRVHLILESQAASAESLLAAPGRGLFYTCGWEERLTEKTFNAIAYGHPFLLVGTNRALDLVKAHGFQTFGSCINESYARINDPKSRMIAVIEEVKRLHKLDAERFNTLYDTCLWPIADANRHKLLRIIRQKQLLQRLYAWGMRDTPAYDLTGEFHSICDDAAAEYGINLTRCRL